MEHGIIGIKIAGLSKNFGAVKAIDGLDVNVEPGTLNGFIGPDGAGKTTLFRILAGLLRPGNGSVTFSMDGREAKFESIRPSLAYMPSKQSLYPDLSIDEHLRFFRDLYGLTREDFLKRSKELAQPCYLEELFRSLREIFPGKPVKVPEEP